MINENVKQTEITICAPCGLYGAQARQFCSRMGSGTQIRKASESRSCRADSLLGVLSLGVKKGDLVQLTGPEHASTRLFEVIKAL